MVDPAVEIIAAFDQERVRVFGGENARLCPNATDLAAARRMLDGGADDAPCRAIFHAVFERQCGNGAGPANSLRYMVDAVAQAVTDGLLKIPLGMRRNATGGGMTAAEVAMARFRALEAEQGAL